MMNKYNFLYYKPGKLFPSEGSFSWFHEKDLIVDDLKDELFSLQPSTFLETFMELFLLDELNLYSFLSFWGDYEERGKGLILFKEKPIYILEMIAFTSGYSSAKKSLNSILITMDQEVEISNLFIARFNVSTLESATVFSNCISSECTGVAINSSCCKRTTILLSYQRS